MKKIRLIVAFAALLSLCSCATYKRLGYLQDMETDVAYSMPQQPEAIISKGDQLDIVVNCSNPELAAPFNVTNGVYHPDNGNGEGVLVSNTAAGNNHPGFEVDVNGDIDYPTLGKLHVAGLTLNQLTKMIEEQIIAKKFIKEPVVRASFSNFKITILGEAGKGVYNIPEGKIDIFGALALSNDLQETAVRDEIWVVRTRDGVRQLYKIDLTTKDCYYSPAFFLQQNDMVYAKPRNDKNDATSAARWSKTSTIISAIATSVNMFFWINNIILMRR